MTYDRFSLENCGGIKHDNNKLQYALIEPAALKSLAEVLTFGAAKYTIDGWKKVPNAKTRYLNALLRHIESYRAGVLIDNEFGCSHLAHAMANIMFLMYFNDDTTNKEEITIETH